jgi:hypothetical protein
MEQGALATRSCTEVESKDGLLADALTDNVPKIHRRCFLHIVGAGMKEWVEGEAGAAAQITAFGTPRDRLAVEVLGGFGGI